MLPAQVVFTFKPEVFEEYITIILPSCANYFFIIVFAYGGNHTQFLAY